MKKRVMTGMAVCLALAISVPVPAVDLNAFGDITLSDSSKKGSAAGFALGQLVLWGTRKIDEDGALKAFMELVVESSGGDFEVDLERLWVEYALSPGLKVRGGRFHTSLGYWNRIHHHGAHMQTTVFRPLFLDFEGGEAGVLPIHMVGLMGVADVDTGAGGLHLELQYGNGSTVNTSNPAVMEIDMQNSGDTDDAKALAARLTFSPAMTDGLGIGISGVVNRVKQDDGTDVTSLVDQTIYAADLSYLENCVELILEHYWIVNKDARTGFSRTGRTSTMWYAQGGYTLFDRLTPYVRYEFFDGLDPNDPYFTTLGTGEYTQFVFGSRFDINNNSSLKLEGRSLTDEPGDPAEETSESYRLQWTFAF